MTATNAKTEAIANADAHTSNAGLPTYSELIAFVQSTRTAGMLAACSSHVVPEYAKEAARLLDKIRD